MGKKHPHYGKSMIIDFPDFSHTMGFVAFSRTVGNLWGNPCISNMMTLVNFFLWLLCFRLMIRSETSSIVKKCGAKIRGQTVASKCLMCLLFFREINSMTMDKTSVRENHHAHFINLMLFKLIIFIRFKLSV